MSEDAHSLQGDAQRYQNQDRLNLLRQAVRLRQKAQEAMKIRGHVPSQFIRLKMFDNSLCFRSTCVACQRLVDVTPAPPPNGIDIGGEAVALNCDVTWEGTLS